MIKLNRITFRNFKVFGDEPYTINFEDNGLVLLDGPNGYGKTSVFDGIELGLTGNISRLISLEGRQNPADIVVAHQGNSYVEIILEFKDSDSKLKFFQRKLKYTVPNSLKKISKFSELWELNEILDGQLVTSSQAELDKYFDSKDFKRDFLLFHYVQQEETSRFLKSNNEIQRAEALSKLFGNTREADEKLIKLRDILAKVTRANNIVTNKIKITRELYKIDVNTDITLEFNERHFYALPWLAEIKRSPFWDDMFIIDFNQEKLNIALEEIFNIKDFIIHQGFYMRSRRFESSMRQGEILKLYLRYFNSINEYDLHISRSKMHQLILIFDRVLKSGELKKIDAIENKEEILKTLGFTNYGDFNVKLQYLLDQENRMDGLGSIYSELIKHHNSMTSQLSKLPNESSCMLCGHDYQSHDALTQIILLHGDTLRAEISGKEKFLVDTRDEFNKYFIVPLIEKSTDYFKRSPAASHEDLLELSKAVSMKERFAKLRSWLKSEGIEHDDLIASTFPIKDENRNTTNELSERIRSKVGNASDGYYEANKGNIFDRIYRDYFDNNKDKLNSISTSQLDDKAKYINELYFNSLKEITSELAILTEKSLLLERARIDIGQIIVIVQKKIKQFRKKLITDIEIPFYIYSGKILQSHQAGLGHGIFIKDPNGNDELKNVRLVSNWASDHDILNTMSSGQISAVVIALTLALHNVYASKFSSILIDDPVQTMDDINMSSLVEVLRNDFKNKQIILSTHEDKVAKYFTYKYLKHNESVKIVNLMKREEYIPRNKFIYESTDNNT
jgi:DNA repair exonuclease SbcCD ATPase subunit